MNTVDTPRSCNQGFYDGFDNLCGQYDAVEPAYRYRPAIRLAPVARIFIRSVIINLTMLWEM